MEKTPGNSLVNIEDLRRVLDLFFRNWYLFLILPLAAGLIAFLYTHRLTETYAAKAQILLNSGETYDYQSQLYQGLGVGNTYATFEKAAVDAGFKSRSDIGLYLRQFLVSHQDTLATQVN